MKHQGGLSLERFARAKSSGYDKRTVLEKAHKKKLNKIGKYKRLLHRMETQGKAAHDRTLDVKDNVEALEQELFGTGDKRPREQQGSAQQPGKKAKQQHTQGMKSHAVKPVPKQQAAHDSDDEELQGSEDAGPSSDDQGAGSEEPGSAGDEEEEQQAWQKRSQGHAGPSGLAQKHQQQSGKQQQQQQDRKQAQQQQEEGDKDKAHAAPGSKHGGGEEQPRHLSRGQRLAQEAAARKAEKQAAREEAAKRRAEHEAKVAAAQKLRQAEKRQFFKRTRTGQPLMRYRMEKILNQLAHS
uniref:rRNA-processing protein FYV7 n=1 Tax=Chlamydomonas leiostraca TaxID=1034604 RepID=A0A7S0WRI4_9CHLO|eukprot:CAMPEP_0202862808 /NCGR_PEP_ID=MMETSP1391-20130828/3708_1 /ASSEMBLY_ACC=CAM_ASM_000867 /TAXON_ID=1034604 /ORGANISM="Chlamydomonas leiostraca, Strain SAG 11-49" /LENGTH=295 /DNA_ID=CAMNT_0049542385 /DNA_START=94 /DNA_END=981 /DNA_ORIENTATION=-